jgi:hypothetical protein
VKVSLYLHSVVTVGTDGSTGPVGCQSCFRNPTLTMPAVCTGTISNVHYNHLLSMNYVSGGRASSVTDAVRVSLALTNATLIV